MRQIHCCPHCVPTPVMGHGSLLDPLVGWRGGWGLTPSPFFTPFDAACGDSS